MRTAARVDSNQASIVEGLRKFGASVYILGLPVDLAVGYNNRTTLVEIKRLTGKRNPKPTKHTQLQREFMSTWKGGPVATVTDLEGAIRAISI